jgi:capsular polysaccharide transport system permease protein
MNTLGPDEPKTKFSAKSFLTPKISASGTVARIQSVSALYRGKIAQHFTLPAVRPDDQQRSPNGMASHETASSWGGRAMLFSFIVTVAVPTIISIIYFYFLASDQFLSEARVTVRAAAEEKAALSDTLSMFSKLGLQSGKTTIQDSYILMNYIKSNRVIEDVGGGSYLSEKFSDGKIDWLSRAREIDTNEDAVKYWNKHIFASLDTLSGIVTLKVFAFKAEDSHEIAQKIISASEQLINKISDRARATSVAEAKAELAATEADLAQARANLQSFRSQVASIDPVAKAMSIGEMIGKLMVERSEIEVSTTSLSGSLSPTSPAYRIQKARMDALDQQIGQLRQQLTSTDSRANTVSSELAKFEQLKLEEKFTEQKYTVAQTSLDKAEQALKKQHLFLSIIVPPQPAQAALFPERGINVLLCLTLALVAWGIASLIVASVADHVAA